MFRSGRAVTCPRAPSARPPDTCVCETQNRAHRDAPSPPKELEHALLWVGGWMRAFVDGACGDAARLRGADRIADGAAWCRRPRRERPRSP
eukprot:2875740-Prymnesium_polylepis.2